MYNFNYLVSCVECEISNGTHKSHAIQIVRERYHLDSITFQQLVNYFHQK